MTIDHAINLLINNNKLEVQCNIGSVVPVIYLEGSKKIKMSAQPRLTNALWQQAEGGHIVRLTGIVSQLDIGAKTFVLVTFDALSVSII